MSGPAQCACGTYGAHVEAVSMTDCLCGALNVIVGCSRASTCTIRGEYEQNLEDEQFSNSDQFNHSDEDEKEIEQELKETEQELKEIGKINQILKDARPTWGRAFMLGCTVHYV